MPHPLIEQLQAATAGHEPTVELLKLLDTFWDRIREIGTPLLRPHPSGDGYLATFLYRVRYQRLQEEGNYARVVVAFDQHAAYQLSRDTVELDHLPRTNAWHREIHVPSDFYGVYCFNLWDSDGLITEDIHEPWAMSFRDHFNPYEATEYDAVYGRNVITASDGPGSGKAGAPDDHAAGGTVVELSVSATLLESPRRRGTAGSGDGDASHPVWAYVPPAGSGDGALPCVMLMNGQFVEHVDIAAKLDRAISDGRIQPVVVITSGRRGDNQNAWGSRGRHGPPPLGDLIREELLPMLVRELGVRPELHLIAFEYPCVAALGTAAEVPALIGSVTLLCPSEGRFGLTRPALPNLAATATAPLILGWPTARTGDFAWTSTVLEEIMHARPDAIRIPHTDPNIYSAADAVIEAIGRLTSLPAPGEWVTITDGPQR